MFETRLLPDWRKYKGRDVRLVHTSDMNRLALGVLIEAKLIKLDGSNILLTLKGNDIVCGRMTTREALLAFTETQDPATSIAAKRDARKRAIMALYKACNGEAPCWIQLDPILAFSGLTREQALSALRYWSAEGMTDATFEPETWGLTHEAVRRIERQFEVVNKPKEGARSTPTVETMSVLFLDVVGWSKLNAAEISSYVLNVMPRVAKHLENKGASFKNTWGDAIIATFRGAKDAAEAALAIVHEFESLDASNGVPEGVHCRIALHTGDVVRATNPVTQREDVFGDGVHRAARLEPVTIPGFIFCTKTFAERLIEARGAAPKALELREVPLAKDYGTELVSSSCSRTPRWILESIS